MGYDQDNLEASHMALFPFVQIWVTDSAKKFHVKEAFEKGYSLSYDRIKKNVLEAEKEKSYDAVERVVSPYIRERIGFNQLKGMVCQRQDFEMQKQAFMRLGQIFGLLMGIFAYGASSAYGPTVSRRKDSAYPLGGEAYQLFALCAEEFKAWGMDTSPIRKRFDVMKSELRVRVEKNMEDRLIFDQVKSGWVEKRITYLDQVGKLFA